MGKNTVPQGLSTLMVQLALLDSNLYFYSSPLLDANRHNSFSNYNSILSQNLVSSLSYDCPLLLTTLTVLGEIALLAPSLFETQRPAIVRDFVVKELLMKDRGETADSNESEGEWCEDRDVTQETQTKIKGIRLLVKWLRGRQGNHKSSVQPVLRLLDSMLTHKGDLQQQGCVK